MDEDTDVSRRLLDLAKCRLRAAGADYLQLDARAPFPFGDGRFDLALATMVFHEVSTPGMRRVLDECRRVLRPPFPNNSLTRVGSEAP